MLKLQNVSFAYPNTHGALRYHGDAEFSEIRKSILHHIVCEV